MPAIKVLRRAGTHHTEQPRPMTIEIVQIREEHIEGFRATLDVVARERCYLMALLFDERRPVSERPLRQHHES